VISEVVKGLAARFENQKIESAILKIHSAMHPNLEAGPCKVARMPMANSRH